MGPDGKGKGLKGDQKKSLRHHQSAWVNELCSHIEEVSGFSKSAPGYWLILEFAHYLHSRSEGHYISPRTFARMSWLLVQLLCGYAFYLNDDLCDSEAIKYIREYLHKLMKDDNDIDGFKGQTYHLSDSKHFGKKKYLGIDRYLAEGVLSNYPRIPSRRTISQLADIMTLSDCYDRGYFVNIQSMWALVENDEKVTLSYRVPRSIALQFRLMALFCIGRPEDMFSVCVMHCWERLGRLLLRKSVSTRGLSEIIDELAKELAK